MTDPMGGMFGDLFKLLGQQGPDAWFATATQLALTVARGDDGDPNPQPPQRQRLEELAPLVGRHVDALFEIASDYSVTGTNRTDLAMAALHQWKPLLEPLTTVTIDSEGDPGDQAAMLRHMGAVMGPLFIGFQLGSVAGHFAERSWSLSALPLPRATREHLIVVNNLVTFADEWSLNRDVVFTFALAREFVATVVLTQAGTGDALRALVLDAVNEVAHLHGDVMGQLQGLMDPEQMAAMMRDPASLLDGVAVPTDSHATRAMNAATAALAQFFDAAALAITETMHGPQGVLREAWRRYRRTDARGEDTAAALFGVSLQGTHHDDADRFVHSLTSAHGLGVFGALLRVDGLPTEEELRDPEAWFARVTNSPLA